MVKQSSLRARLDKQNKQAVSRYEAPERMLESIRQSLKVEGFDIPLDTIRDIAKQVEASSKLAGD